MSDLFIMCLAGAAFLMASFAAYRALTRPVHFGPPLHFATTSDLLTRAAAAVNDPALAAALRDRAAQHQAVND